MCWGSCRETISLGYITFSFLLELKGKMPGGIFFFFKRLLKFVSFN